ncbi:MAG: hypothetical protein A3F84_24045 [Candidatus Handelsmanbacteria bacterium RIFCSPLOWO2_12_FULL_64_10]|uniref:Uncharacterized protein n=1 Tax=Handelsmanbacteria sp. (strain RIFCSPLOWO2_12_FULL_64_10) TaxID=1817868 RepID=A0A1F6C330_HANXR|nr:MAG: hypothetical protein A3F84_24045 [Candidatus Handelsmanbacteria bacterium RIFCSPLOWO2_12_FULL_64_10]
MTDRLTLPIFEIVNVFCDVAPTLVLSIVKEVTDTLITGADEGGVATPLPASATEDGLPTALWAIDIEAVLSPAEVGANVTVIVTLCPAASVAVAGETVNCKASGPPTVISVTDMPVLPGFEIVNVFWEVEPTLVLSNVSEEAERVMPGLLVSITDDWGIKFFNPSGTRIDRPVSTTSVIPEKSFDVSNPNTPIAPRAVVFPPIKAPPKVIVVSLIPGGIAMAPENDPSTLAPVSVNFFGSKVKVTVKDVALVSS